ncbi:MAG TPA: class I SAM-dependent methyltransferase [Usitatibacter sp.]|nr:class I SAM-dependent methyltransferase [Usitatibacter sp.]
MLDKNHAQRGDARAPIGGLPQYWSDEPSRRRYLDHLFDGTAGDYDFVERLLGFGSGPWHRRQALRRAGLTSGMQVLDIATGTGLVAREALALVGPEGRVVGLDPSAGMLQQAGALAIPLVRALGERLPCRDASFDFVSMGYALRHVADLERLFAEMRRVLKPGGTACVLELTRPSSALMAEPLRIFMTGVVPAVARVWRRNDHARRLMQFYWDTIDACVPPEAVLAALTRAGLADARRDVSLGMFSDYTGRKR